MKERMWMWTKGSEKDEWKNDCLKERVKWYLLSEVLPMLESIFPELNESERITKPN